MLRDVVKRRGASSMIIEARLWWRRKEEGKKEGKREELRQREREKERRWKMENAGRKKKEKEKRLSFSHVFHVLVPPSARPDAITSV